MPDKKLTKKTDLSLLVILACGATVEAAAKQLGISERTIYRRLEKPEFKQQIAEVRRDMLQRTAGSLTASGSEAVRTLIALLNEKRGENVRLGAARALLEMGIKVREAAYLEDRVLQLEEEVSSIKEKRK